MGLSLGGSAFDRWWLQASASAVANREHDLNSAFVHDYLMVEPAHDYQLLLVGVSALGPRSEMMDLETTLATAAVGATGVVVVVEQRPSQGRRGSALPPAEMEDRPSSALAITSVSRCTELPGALPYQLLGRPPARCPIRLAASRRTAAMSAHSIKRSSEMRDKASTRSNDTSP